MSGYSNPLGASILIALGMIFVVLGIDGTARVRIEGLGDATLVISGVDGIIMTVVGGLFL